MDSSSVCEKTRIDLVVKNSRNLFFKTLLKNSPFNMKVFGSKTSRDKRLEVYEKLFDPRLQSPVFSVF